MTQNSKTHPDKIKPSFSGHETFPFRYTWLKKGVDAVRDDPSVFTSDRATITLGVGKNMVRSIDRNIVAEPLESLNVSTLT